jgi:hypothetical protein
MSLAYKIPSGFIHAFEISSPRYLKFFTVSTYSPYISNLELQFTYMACVLSKFMRSELVLQNYSNLATKVYNSLGDDAISTISSAKDSRNI